MFAPIHPVAGVQPFNDWFVPDTVQRLQLGVVVDAVDPYWGYGRFVYAQANGAINKGELCAFDAGYDATKTPNTANLGQPFYVAMNSMADNTFGWFQCEGVAVYKTGSTVAADVAIGVTAAGVLGTNAAGKQAMGVHNLRSATATKAITNVSTQNGSPVLKTSGYDGWFVGMALSGTGIPASTVVARLDPDGMTVYTGSAIGTVGDKNSTATGSVTVTGTYTGYGAGRLNAPHVQGAIT